MPPDINGCPRKCDCKRHYTLTSVFLTCRSHDQSELDAVQSTLGAIVVAREPLTDEELSQL